MEKDIKDNFCYDVDISVQRLGTYLLVLKNKTRIRNERLNSLLCDVISFFLTIYFVMLFTVIEIVLN